MSFDETAYGPLFGELLRVDRNRPLDGGLPNSANRDRLASLSIDEAFAHSQVVDLDQARCCLSGMWLVYDFLDESHTISQNVATVEGSFWHGIMHRREGDFSNAKYWFRKVGAHPVFGQLAEDWDPYDFVDQCQRSLGSGEPSMELCRELQQREWELLFHYCYSQALGQEATM